MFASMGKGPAWLSVVVGKQNNLGPDQRQSGPSEETVSPLKAVVELFTHTGVGEGDHHQMEAQHDPGDDNSGERDPGRQLTLTLQFWMEGTYERQFVDVFMSGHSDEEDQPDCTRNAAARVY